jgi:C-terminal processing protease CtpA/Prc
MAATTEREYTASILRSRTRIHDTHTFVHSRGADSFFGTYLLPMPLVFVEGNVLVEKSNPNVGVQRGDVLLSINGERVDSLIQNLRQYANASNEAIRNTIVAGNFLRYRTTSSATLEVRSDAGTKRVQVQCIPLSIYKPPAPPAKPMMRVIDSTQKLLYVDFTQITQAQIRATMDTIRQMHGVVFDLRGYPQDALYGMMSQLADPTPFAFVRRFGYWLPGQVIEYANSCGSKRTYMGKVVVLVNERAISHAEFTAMALQTIPGMKTVGSQTAGADGDVKVMRLPGGVAIALTSVGVYYPDKTPTQRKGVRIDVEAHPTIAGIRAGRDEVLEKGVEVLREMITTKK